uniref:Solute carrier family 24 member 2 n=1 Tax=Salmo trutta TaxID=8032 RepID=A0A674CTD9_SALTR
MMLPGADMGPQKDSFPLSRRHHYLHVRRKLRPIRILAFVLSIVTLSTVFSLGAFQWTTSSTGLDGNGGVYFPPPPLLCPRETYCSRPPHGGLPTDLFNLEQRRQGAVSAHVWDVVHVHRLSHCVRRVLCPGPTVITEKLQISDDVAGATFMAAGGSAPELFTSVIGVFISHSNEVLQLTWWPLFRDVSFYIIGLLMLILFFWITRSFCGKVSPFQRNVETFIKSKLGQNQVDEVQAAPKVSFARYRDEILMPIFAKPRLQRGGSSASLHNTLMRNSIFQLMIHTLDPLTEGEGLGGKTTFFKASILHKMAKQKCQDGGEGEKPNGVADKNVPNSSNVTVEVTSPANGDVGPVGFVYQAEEEEEDEDTPLSLEWPGTTRKRITYLLILPIVFPLWLSLPDVRRETSKKFFPITFIGAICWIAAFSYLMVWWAHQVGETFWITEEIMGLTILAAGTSIPDLITSVIVARKGLGDMAVSSSVGSNIFDITVGLPFPWLIYGLVNDFKAVQVSSNGLFCAIVLLFLMLLFVIISIASCKWKMSKVLGGLMFLLYIFFLVTSVMLEDKIIVCPISI